MCPLFGRHAPPSAPSDRIPVDRADTAGVSTPAVAPAAALRRRLARGSALVFVGKVGASTMGIAINALLARLLPEKQLGVYFLVFSTATFASTIAALGFDRAVVRLVAVSMAKRSPGRAREAALLTFRIGAAGSLLTSAVLLIGGGRFLSDVFGPAFGGVTVGLAAWAIALTFQTLVAETFRGFQRYGLATISDGLVANAFVLAVFALLFLSGSHVTLARAVTLTVALTSLALVGTGCLLLRRTRRLPGGTHVLQTGEVASLAWPLLVTNAAMFCLSWGVDLWTVGAFRPHQEVALYGAAARLVFFIAVPNLIMLQVVPPITAQLHAQGRYKALEHVLRSIATLATVPAALVLVIFTAAGGLVMSAVYGPFYRQGASVLAVLCLARLLAVAAGPCGSTLMMTGHQRAMMFITIVCGAFSVLAGIGMVFTFGMVGVAVSTCLGQILQNALMLTFVKRRLGIWTHARLSLEPLREVLRTAHEVVARNAEGPA